MSKTPIFDAVLADSDPDIFLAGNVFPRPVTDDFTAALIRAGHPSFKLPFKQQFGPAPDYTDWSAIRQPIWAAGGVA